MREPARSAGFTLVELLVVLVVISLLFALVMVGTMTSRNKARQATCQSNLRQIGIALRMYMEDHGGFPPPYPCGMGDTLHCENYVAAVAPYLQRTREVWFCPADPYVGQDTLPDEWGVDHRFTSYELLGAYEDRGRLWLPTPNWLGRDGYDQAHSGGSNVLFWDGRVRWLTPQARGEADTKEDVR